MSGRAIFLDRDGVVNKVVLRKGTPSSPRTVDEFELEADAHKSISRLKAAGFKIFVVSNQPDLARGHLTRAALDAMTGTVLATLPVDGVRICPHDDDDACSCRKPKPGMLIDLARENRLVLSQSFMIGDSWKDSTAAARAGCRSIILDRPYNQNAPADLRVTDLGQAADVVLEDRLSDDDRPE
jgi:D-glycero-D-manno-heptose 1,7-bisphosphate phosphatase